MLNQLRYPAGSARYATQSTRNIHAGAAPSVPSRIAHLQKVPLQMACTSRMLCRSVVNHFHSSHVEEDLECMQRLLDVDVTDTHHREGKASHTAAGHSSHGHHDHAAHAGHTSHASTASHAAHATQTAHSAHARTTSHAATHYEDSQSDEDTCEDECGEDPSIICLLDSKTDTVEVMQLLRHHLLMCGRCILKLVDSRPGILLDAISMLHLLNQDLRLEEDYQTCVFFQPLASEPLLGTSAIHSSIDSMALLVTRTKAPELLRQLPSYVLGPASSSSQSSVIQPSSTTSEVWDMAHVLVDKLESHALIQLRCVSPRGLVVGLRGLRRARRLVRLAGDADILVSPHIVTEHGVPTICLNCWRTPAPSQAGDHHAGELHAHAREHHAKEHHARDHHHAADHYLH